MELIKGKFKEVRLLRAAAESCKPFQVTKKMEYAEKALDAMEIVIFGLIQEVEDLKSGQ